MLSKRFLGCLLFAMLAPGAAMAKPDIQLEMKAEKEIVIVEDGETVTKQVVANSIEQGDIIIYTLFYKNSGDEEALNVVINNPVPKNTTYLPGTATGEGADISFSIDEGKSYKKPTLLTYEINTAGGSERRKATPDLYTHIRWVVKTISPGESGTVGFRVRVK